MDYLLRSNIAQQSCRQAGIIDGVVRASQVQLAHVPGILQFMGLKSVIARVPLAIISRKQLHHAKRLVVLQRPGDVMHLIGLLEQALRPAKATLLQPFWAPLLPKLRG